jgi:hypothetical protein
LKVHKNYGTLNVPCTCGVIHKIFTGKHIKSQSDVRVLDSPKDKAIYDELDLLDYSFIKKDNYVIFSGRMKNKSKYLLSDVIGSYSFNGSDKEFLFFPELNVLKNKDRQKIYPFIEFEFSQILTDDESEEAQKCNFDGFKLTFLQYDRIG